MNNNVDWNLVRNIFEKEMASKLHNLPGHREATESLLDLRSIISHELPETASESVYKLLINLLLSGECNLCADEIRKNYLLPELEKETRLISTNQEKYGVICELTKNWVEKYLPEDTLQQEWKEHKTWLPRRYTIYLNPDIPFQRIAIDTLARYCLIHELVK